MQCSVGTDRPYMYVTYKSREAIKSKSAAHKSSLTTLEILRIGCQAALNSAHITSSYRDKVREALKFVGRRLHNYRILALENLSNHNLSQSRLPAENELHSSE